MLDFLNVFDTVTVIRLSKAVLTLTVGALAALVVLGNVTDFGVNFNFVQHVLRMDSILPDSAIRARAIQSPRAHRLAYFGIIGVELLVALFCLGGGLVLLVNWKASGEVFQQAKRLGIVGLVLGLLNWFFGFQVVAAEWFGMWQSKEWNALPDASRLTSYLVGVLVFVSLANDV